jgi:hypothetical protein
MKTKRLQLGMSRVLHFFAKLTDALSNAQKVRTIEKQRRICFREGKFDEYAVKF